MLTAFQQEKNGRSIRLASAPVVCGSELVSNPCGPIVLPMLKPQASVTCQHGCSTDCQPQNVSNEHIFLEVVKFLSQLITKFDCVVAGSLPKKGKNAHSPDVPMFSPKGQVNCEKSLNGNVSQGVSTTEWTKGKTLTPEFKNENLEVNDVGDKFIVSKKCHDLCDSSGPEPRSHVTDSVSLPVSSCRLDSIHPFDGDNFNISVLIEFVKFRAIIDTGAAVTAVDTKVWNKYLSHTDCCLDSPSTNCLTSVSGSLLVILGKVCLNFVIKSVVLPF